MQTTADIGPQDRDGSGAGPAIDFSVVVPVYNSEQTLAELFQRLQRTFAGMGRSFEVIFVEDCGRDQSWRVIREIQEQHPAQAVGVKLGRNFGQHNATLCGLHFARGRFAITIDDDLQVPPEEIPKLVAEQERSGADLVYGYFAEKKHGRLQNLGSFVVQKVFEFTFGRGGKGSSFRLFTADLAARLRTHRQNYVFLDGLMLWYTQYVSRTLVDHQERRHGQSGYSLGKLIQLAANLFFNFTTLPLRWVTYLGLLSSTLCFVLGLTFLVRRLIYDVPVGWTSLAVAIFFVGGVILVALGFIGEYISRIFSLHNERPQFSIREVRRAGGAGTRPEEGAGLPCEQAKT